VLAELKEKAEPGNSAVIQEMTSKLKIAAVGG
jgi:hypothetical protein